MKNQSLESNKRSTHLTVGLAVSVVVPVIVLVMIGLVANDWEYKVHAIFVLAGLALAGIVITMAAWGNRAQRLAMLGFLVVAGLLALTQVNIILPWIVDTFS